MILEEETHRKFGYYPSELSPRSGKKVVCACDGCGKIRILEKDFYHSLCISCSKKGKRNPHFGKRRLIKVICKYCGIEFSIKPSGIKHGRGKFCSTKCKAKWQSSDPKTRKRFLDIRCKRTSSTKPERIFDKICKKNNLPFRFVGDGQFWIGKRKKLNPDFIEANGKKICIEIMGDYWHSPILNKNIKESRTLQFRKRHFKRYKWIPIFIWTTDLDRKDAEAFVLNKLQKEGVIK